jgi:hypothetical protein
MVARAGLGDEAPRFWDIFDLLTRESLEFEPAATSQRFSGICRDGSPWQFCVVLGTQPGSTVRFLTEVGAPGVPLGARTDLTIERIIKVFELINVAGQREAAEVLAGLTPSGADHIAGLWVGFAMGGEARPRLRLYANNGWGEMSSRWLRLIAALRQLKAGHFGASLQPHLDLLVPAFSPAGFAITLPPSPPLCKLYLRPIASPWSTVRTLAQSILGPRSDDFISAIEKGFGKSLDKLPERALIVSTAGSAAGGPLDLKIDLCGHCLFVDDIQPMIVVERLASSLGLDVSPYHAIVEDLVGLGATIPHKMFAFVGVGANSAGENRINLYLTPPALNEASMV